MPLCELSGLALSALILTNVMNGASEIGLFKKTGYCLGRFFLSTSFSLVLSLSSCQLRKPIESSPLSPGEQGLSPNWEIRADNSSRYAWKWTFSFINSVAVIPVHTLTTTNVSPWARTYHELSLKLSHKELNCYYFKLLVLGNLLPRNESLYYMIISVKSPFIITVSLSLL